MVPDYPAPTSTGLNSSRSISRPLFDYCTNLQAEEYIRSIVEHALSSKIEEAVETSIRPREFASSIALCIGENFVLPKVGSSKMGSSIRRMQWKKSG